MFVAYLSRLIRLALCYLLCLNTFYSQDFDYTNFSSEKPFFETPPYHYDGCKVYFITAKTNPETLRKLVPEPLIPVSNGVFTFVFLDLHIVKPMKFDYLEAYFAIPVSYNNTVGSYHPVLYLSEIESILPGREIYGYNKTLADINFEEVDNIVNISVSIRDTIIIKASLTLGESMPPPKEKGSPISFFHKYIPSIEKNALPDVNQITMTEIKNNEIADFKLGKGTIELFNTKYDPFDKIKILEIMNAGYNKQALTLDYGKVVHDFNKEKDNIR